jgi:hypothetical protein
LLPLRRSRARREVANATSPPTGSLMRRRLTVLRRGTMSYRSIAPVKKLLLD